MPTEFEPPAGGRPEGPNARHPFERITGNWWALALRALAAILIGIFALSRPHITILALVTLFGVYALADGLFAIVAALRTRTSNRWGWMLVEGIIGAAVGLYVLVNPGIGAIALTWMVAAWALITGFLEIFAGVRLRKTISGEWLLLLGGALSVVLAIVVVARPGIGLSLLVAFVGVYAIMSGVILFSVALRVRRWGKAHPPGI